MSNKNKPKILIVGANGSLGSYLLDHLDAEKFCRNSNIQDFISESYDVIIYCASNNKNLRSHQLTDYFYDNYELLRDIINIKHQYLIYFSSVDVYPENAKLCLENLEFELRDIKSPYALFKLLSEELIKKVKKNNFAILRPSMMLSSNSPKNNLKRLLEDASPKLSVSEDSEYNVILYSDVLNIVKFLIDTRQSGIFNLASSQNIKLHDLALRLNKIVDWGGHLYKLQNIDVTKISLIDPIFLQSSEQAIARLYK
jgi:nucleoside-diphosphate-sugar epimerase